MNSKLKLGINIDHVATIRNARGGLHPDPLKAALIAQSSGADNITAHLREDRRHISDIDIKKLVKKLRIPLNLEMALTNEMLNIAISSNVNRVCLVPEKRKEITTEGGLNLKKNKNKIKKIILKLKKFKIRTSLFINPSIKDVKLSKELKADCIELHTGKFSELIKSNKNFFKEFKKIKNCSKFGNSIGLEIHAGHGMDYKTTKILNKIKEIKEFNIGHFIIGESIYNGFKAVIKKIKKISKN